MALLTYYWILDVLAVLLPAISAFYLNFILRTRNYWIRRNIPSLTPSFFFGNTKEANVKKRISDVIDQIYFENKKIRMLGAWLYVKPVLIATDLDLMKDILVKYFSHFHDRGIVVHEDLEPLTAHLFNVSGQQWRNLRVKLAPTFTSGKMKMMFETMFDVGINLQNCLDKSAALGGTIEMKEVMACYTTDVISSCAFGVEAQSLENPNSQFRKHGRNIFHFGLMQVIALVMNFVAPTLQKLLRLQQFPKDTTNFFLNAVQDVFDYREKNGLQRNDFVNLMIQLKNKGFIDDVDYAKKNCEAKDSSIGRGTEFTTRQAAAQLFVFFFAGFETSSTLSIFALYELAIHPEIQQKLQAEIDRVLLRYGKLTYDSLQEMLYLDWTLQETLRKYPPVPMLFRECTKDYEIPETSCLIKKGDLVVIPISAVLSDASYFPEPHRFDPERFSPDRKAERDSFLNLAFGAGPRVCIGSKFGLLQVKVGLVMVLSKFNIEITAETPIPLNFEPAKFFPSPVGGMKLKISRKNTKKNGV